MFSKKQMDKVDINLRKKMSIMFNFEFNGLLLLGGQSLKNIIMDNKVKMYNFILLTLERDNVLDFFKKNKLKYKAISNSEYEFVYNNVKVSIAVMNDLTNGATLSTDFLFYDIERKQFIPVGIKYAIQDKKIYDFSDNHFCVNYDKNDLKEKEEEGVKFIQFLRGDNKRIKVKRKNKFWRMFNAFLKHRSKIK